MSRPMVRRLLPRAWVPMQVAHEHVRVAATYLRNYTSDDCTCGDCENSREDYEQAAKLLDVCADDLRSRWLPHEQEVSGEDLLMLEATEALSWGDHSPRLPEAGVRIVGPAGTLYLRYADSTSPDEPELILPSSDPMEEA